MGGQGGRHVRIRQRIRTPRWGPLLELSNSVVTVPLCTSKSIAALQHRKRGTCAVAATALPSHCCEPLRYTRACLPPPGGRGAPLSDRCELASPASSAEGRTEDLRCTPSVPGFN